jgi:hypothetical protein
VPPPGSNVQLWGAPTDFFVMVVCEHEFAKAGSFMEAGVHVDLMFSTDSLSPFSHTRDAGRRVRMCKSESKKRFENGCGSNVVEFSLNENYEH